MHKRFLKVAAAVALLCGGTLSAQSTSEILTQMGHLIDDALFYSDKYITPATDAAIYQASSGWIATPRKRELWDVTIGVHTNIFFTPNRDRAFVINNSDLSFFTLENGTSATVPTAVGNKDQVYLTGQLGDSEVRLKTPQGINRDVVAYPYFQGSVALWYGTELVAKYSPKVQLKRSNYQVYGVGVTHNISQYIKKLQERDYSLSALAAYSREDVNVEFLNVQTDYGTLGIDAINGLVDTWQFQLNGAKTWGNFELMGGFIINTSNVEYRVSGERGSIEDLLPLQDVLNKRLEEIYKTRVNYIGEVSATYKIGKFNVQSILAFGKFVNTNLSLQYLF